MKLTLHIGLPKTATTTIQHSLFSAKDDLAAQGICYPGHFVDHHDMFNSISTAPPKPTKFGRKTHNILTRFAQEAEKIAARHVLISSETMITGTSTQVEKLRLAVEKFFPAVTQIKVLCYVREPISFAASLGQQLIKSGDLRLSDLYDDPWRIAIADCLGNYQTVFGHDNIDVRYLQSEHLKNSNVLEDFLDALGAGPIPMTEAERALNSSLSAEAVAIADALVVLRPRTKRLRMKRKSYKRVLENIGGRKFVLPAEVQDRVVKKSRLDVAFLQDNFGIPIKAKRQPVENGFEMPLETTLSLASLIEKHIENK